LNTRNQDRNVGLQRRLYYCWNLRDIIIVTTQWKLTFSSLDTCNKNITKTLYDKKQQKSCIFQY